MLYRAQDNIGAYIVDAIPLVAFIGSIYLSGRIAVPIPESEIWIANLMSLVIECHGTHERDPNAQ
jgi:hypothetical protein